MELKLVEGHRRYGRWIVVPLADITTPKPGRICFGPNWWRITENNEVLFFGGYHSPLCNSNLSIAEKLGRSTDTPETTLMYLDMAYLPHNCGDY